MTKAKKMKRLKPSKRLKFWEPNGVDVVDPIGGAFDDDDSDYFIDLEPVEDEAIILYLTPSARSVVAIIPQVTGVFDGVSVVVPQPKVTDRFKRPDRVLPEIDPRFDPPGTSFEWNTTTGFWKRMVPMCSVGMKSQVLIGLHESLQSTELLEEIKQIYSESIHGHHTDDAMHAMLDASIEKWEQVRQSRS